MESWRKVWREGILPSLTEKNLLDLKEGLEKDDINLLQGKTTSPPPLMMLQDWLVEGACSIGYMGWKSGLSTVREVEEFFARICFETDQRLGEAAVIRYYLNWWDDEPRNKAIQELLNEVNLAIQTRTS